MEVLDWTLVPLEDEGAVLDSVLSDDGLTDGVLPGGAFGRRVHCQQGTSTAERS